MHVVLSTSFPKPLYNFSRPFRKCSSGSGAVYAASVAGPPANTVSSGSPREVSSLSVPSHTIPNWSSVPFGEKLSRIQNLFFVSARNLNAGPIVMRYGSVSNGNSIWSQHDGGTATTIHFPRKSFPLAPTTLTSSESTLILETGVDVNTRLPCSSISVSKHCASRSLPPVQRYTSVSVQNSDGSSLLRFERSVRLPPRTAANNPRRLCFSTGTVWSHSS